ncbi:MAG: hypothetical protein E7571_01345 [Ruminococcaceae bacterium]|nr:hypothetical protein [Oscillospiraceae bacterium]
MIFVIIILLLYFFFDGMPVTFFTLYTAMLIIHISLAVLVSTNAKAKQRDGGTLWAVFSFFLGVPIALLYFLLNIGLGTENENKKLKNRQRNAIIYICTVLVVAAALTPVYVHEFKQSVLQEEFDSAGRMAYLNADGTHYICYDKIGKTYSVDDCDWIPYYTPDNKALELEDYSGEVENRDFTKDYCRYVSADGKVRIEQDRAFINEGGYMVDKDAGKMEEIVIEEYDDSDCAYFIYEDKNGELYFNPADCSWDGDGNLVFESQEITDYVKEHKG